MSQVTTNTVTSNVNPIKIGKKAFASSTVILLALLVLAGLLTRVVPAGSYARHIGADGVEVIDVESFEYSANPPLPAWKWFTAPVEVLGSAEGTVVIGIIVFFLCIGGSISLLNQGGVFGHMIARVAARYGARREQLIAATVLVLMLMSALTGIMEEAVFLVPLMIPLAAGLGMSPIIGPACRFSLSASARRRPHQPLHHRRRAAHSRRAPVQRALVQSPRVRRRLCGAGCFPYRTCSA